jgi:hypothetical protein
VFGFGKKIKDPVRGTAQVVGTSGLNPMATSQTCKMTLVVQAEGMAPYSTEHKCTAKASKWPYAGRTLPVTVDRSDPTRLRVEWDEVPEAADVHRDQAAALVDSLRNPATMSVQAQPYDPSNPQHRQALDAAEAATGMDLNGDGRVAGRGEPADHIAQLERLVALRDSGALTPEEFEAEKKRLLGS